MSRDPALAVELEIFKHLFASIAEEMGHRLQRAAYSPNIKERRDFSCALFDARAEMIAQAAHIPVHLGSTPMSVQAALAAFPPETLRPGDRILLNDPYQGGTHLPDLTLVVPCFVEDEPLPRFFVANRAHHADVGGASPGSMPLSRHIDDEGLRLPPTRLDEALIARICAASRTPDERLGDLRAQVAAAELGVARLRALCARHGASLVSLRADQLQDYAERVTRALLAQLPEGEYAFEDALDDDGISPDPVALRCALTLKGGELIVDLRGCAPQVEGPLNAVRAIAVSAVAYAVRCLAPEELPSNGGVMRPVRVLTTPGTVVDAAWPAPVAAGNVETSQRLVDLLFGALAQAAPHLIPAASCGSMNNVTIGGEDPRTGAAFAYYETLGGGAGGGPEGPGGDAIHTHMTNTLNTPIEALERAWPLRVERYRIRDGSGGEGLHQGGCGLERQYVFEAAAEVTLLTERRQRAPWGAQGGGPGAVGINLHNGRPIPGKVSLRVEAGDTLTLLTPGGGGWGARTQEPGDEPG
jgi:N-methylhydantoinase B